MVGITNTEINSKAEKIEKWCFPPTEPTEDKKRELAARVAEARSQKRKKLLLVEFSTKWGGGSVMGRFSN